MMLYTLATQIKVYGIIDVMHFIDPESTLEWDDTEALDKWMAEHDAIYYAAPSDTFSIHDAMHNALVAGKSAVVVENLS